ncbi:hypothetical protein VV869_13355 [Photobacterium sp. MCCC 1A19761]|uniref:hypothetical protein n=1 Tax=Photobacterium sp. MCCC 1A19761 TaxID=3115000 RepID=UPI00307F347D
MMKIRKPIWVALGFSGLAVLTWGLIPTAQSPAIPEAPVHPAQLVNHAPETLANQTVAAAGADPIPNITPQLSGDGSEAHQATERQPVQLARQLTAISDVYAAEVQYPPYSKPITSKHASYLEPNRFTAVEMPVLGGSSTAALSLPKYRFFAPEEVTLSLKSELAVNTIRYEFYDVNSHQRFLVKHTDQKSLNVPGSEWWPQEIRVKATVDFEQGTDVLTADFQYQVPVAVVLSAEAPAAQGADMLIPLNLDVSEAGIYRIRANLYREDGQVIAALSQKSRLGEGRQSFTLKAHQSVLGGTDGRYLLKNWVVERMSGMPGEKASFGISQQPVMALVPFDASGLRREAYTPSPQEQQRLHFLRQAGVSE